MEYRDSIALEKILERFPFFQSALILYVKLLKENNILHHKKLYKAAALTSDRSVLFRFLENIEDFAGTSEKKEKISLDKPVEEEILKEQEEKESVKGKEIVVEKTQKEKNKPEKMSYSEWLKFISQTGTPKKVKNRKQDPIFELIDRFIKEKPKIVPKRNYSAPPPESVIKSVEEKQMLMTETLANLYIKQKKYDKAIQAFKILSLKYPKKSSYFANRIQELKKQIKK